MPVISLREISFKYLGGMARALDGISLDVREGEFLLVLGGDGSGKSTLCKTLNGLIPHETKGEFSGEALLRGQSMNAMHAREIVRSVGLSLQDPDVQLFTDSVEEEVAFGPENLGVPVNEIDERVSRALEMTGLSSLKDKSPSALSGGQKQRLAIAAVLSMSPEVIVLDEPLSMLDPKGRAEFLLVLDALRKETGMAVVMTSQEAEEVLPHCDRVAILSKGALVGIGTPAEMMKSPQMLESLGVEPPQLLALSESLSRAGLNPGGSLFYDEGGAMAVLGRSGRAGGR